MATVRPDDLHRSVTNLVENAVRYGAEATIRLRVSPDTATIEVEDDGPGISDARKEVMLEPFGAATTPAIWMKPPASFSASRSPAPLRSRITARCH